ncbi:MAG TPA: POTRA domain-containing protein [Blastocatellia bacterium]|nr:POTRA domain-containing protein [Blastocatellia bacterium]
MKHRLLILLLGVGLINAQSVLSLHSQSNMQQRDPSVYYRFGKITVDGAKTFTTDEILKLAGIKSNMFASPAVIDNAAEVIRRAYLNRGHVRVQVQVTTEYEVISPRSKMGLVGIAININEGSAFRLRRLEFTGSETTKDDKVYRKMVLRTGEPYNQDLMDKSLRNLNGLKRFETLTMADVEINTDEQQRTYDLLIHLKEIKRR